MGQGQSLNQVFPDATMIVIESQCESMTGRSFHPNTPMPRGVTDNYKWSEFAQTMHVLVRRYWSEGRLVALLPLIAIVFLLPNVLDRDGVSFILYPAALFVFVAVLLGLSFWTRSANMAVDRDVQMTATRYSHELGVAIQFYQQGTGMCKRKGQATRRILIIHPTATPPQHAGMLPMLLAQQQALGMYGIAHPQAANNVGGHPHQNPPYAYGAAAPPPYGASADPYGNANVPVAPVVYGSNEPPPPYAEASLVPVAQPIYDASQPIKCWTVSFPPPNVPAGHLCMELTCPRGYSLRNGTQVVAELPDGRKMNITVNKDLSGIPGSVSETMMFFAPL
eukprot:CAMPEP_0206218436 /NCGR_PEP_ID=MMETSP0047_2-20121206/3799_1 /ASSEMBLY_ACC=CAM_ASM_000192 /TAXON_ID=195065 /ORGANISM="Chroomonas mesostigmatica_cf, Strain CCMP1168" /LENGTH=335 /DNA_ID=CAMNT_0053640941 /DNA_START=106 /DNA_END=1113 /DNA_ORIENTATION=+